ncbi:hypothetical protein FJ934_14145 [Mesorhizobium sp. B2-4-12]|nr:hypothetical protein FJ934_14145 [Mesorhizobium sp. B2-4-12]
MKLIEISCPSPLGLLEKTRRPMRVPSRAEPGRGWLGQGNHTVLVVVLVVFLAKNRGLLERGDAPTRPAQWFTSWLGASNARGAVERPRIEKRSRSKRAFTRFATGVNWSRGAALPFRAKLGRMRGAPAWHRRRSFQHPSTVLALRANPPSPTGREGEAVPLALYKSDAKKYERPRLFWLALRQARYVLHDERGTLNSERTRCPTSKVSFLRWHKRWKNAAMPS